MDAVAPMKYGAAAPMKHARRAGLLLAISLAGVRPAGAVAAGRPEHVFRVKDASRLVQLVRENAWMAEFFQSALYRGAQTRLGPVLFALGDQNDNAWSGRLVDFAAEKILSGKGLTIAYFNQAGLVSPLGMTIGNLGPAEKALIATLLRRLATSKKPVKVELESARKTVALQAIAVKFHKFAAVVHGNCLSVGRDPQVVAELSLACDDVKNALDARSVDAEWRVDLAESVPSVEKFLRTFYGLSGTANFDFVWESNKFVPRGGSVPLAPAALRPRDKLPESLIKLLPGDSVFVATLWLPKPRTLDVTGLREALKAKAGSDRKSEFLPVSLVFFGNVPQFPEASTEGAASARPVSLSAVIFPNAYGKGEDLKALFSGGGDGEILFKELCGHWVLSNQVESLQRVESACGGRSPSFAQLPDDILGKVEDAKIAGSFYFNPGRWLSTSLELGWALSQRRANPPGELASAQTLLNKLSRYYFYGASAAGQGISVEGVASK